MFCRTRFAPSPTGYLHLGHVVSALYAQSVAGAECAYHVRIEDCDQLRCKDSFKIALKEDLHWLGLWPESEVRVQSCHKAEYESVLEELRRRDLLYPCWCTRRDLALHATQKAPDGSWVHNRADCAASREAFSPFVPQWRLDMRKALTLLGGEPVWRETGHCAGQGVHKGNAAAFGDIVLARRDTGLSYHLCVTFDDALQGIECVTRGMDIEPLTAIHRVLQELMGWPEPLYAHHALIMDVQTGKKLSKRDGAEGIRTLRAQGWSAAQVRDHPLVRQALSASLQS